MLARRLGDLLEKNQIATTPHVQECLGELEKDPKKRLARLLVDKGYVDERKLIDFFTKQYAMPSIDLSNFEVNPDLVAKLTPQFCSNNFIIPIGIKGDTVVIATADPTEQTVFDQIRFALKLRAEPVLAAASQIKSLLEKITGVPIDQVTKDLGGEALGDVSFEEATDDKGAGSDDLNAEEAAPIVKFVAAVLTDAIRRRASDIHIEPYENDLRVRVRVDGDLVDSVKPPPQVKKPLVARIKVMSKMRLDERRVPQDGRIRFKLPEGKTVDFRVSTCPTVYGEKVVIRILDKSAAVISLDKLGFEPEDQEKFIKAIKSPWGMALVTGATGSGKTTTLYAALNALNTVDVNISTIEDPVEYNFAGINQCQVHEQVGFTFAGALKSFLRQDPDIILLGEIRDTETASIAMKAALTGHMVLSTLHTNDAPATLARLKDLEIEPFLINSALKAVVAQKLVRGICKNCKDVDDKITKDDLIKLGFPEKVLDKFKPMKGKGCPACRNTGCTGRRAVHEVLEMTENIRNAFGRGASTDEIKKIAVSDGMKTMKTNTMKKIMRGEVPAEELQSVGDDQ
jgi:type IV pilus assembly protein PilB